MTTSFYLLASGADLDSDIKQLKGLETIPNHSKNINEIICGGGFIMYCEKLND